ncbi:arrestin domain-containing protein 17-like [Melitaea cinxia]|uniref:arrestin domain-containing protein 17-like n=1 Tax=Melitaea cinxia TaxID=113334 RepID=UPI001E26F0AF|nr:arrestin domain-containing protein 17-like [Melitaea cinxia]
MGFDEGQIVLDSPNGTYFSGQTIRGKLIFQQDTVKTFRGIYVIFNGYCKVHWTTTETRRVNNRNVTHTKSHDSYEEYINQKIYLVGSESGEHHIQPGNYEYPFTFRVPDNCPSSFEGDYGRIRYKIKAIVDRAFKFDQEKKVAIRVWAPLDLNMNPYCRESIEMDFDSNYYCCCFSSGSTNTVVNVPVSGFCPGQKIPIEVTCMNKGTVIVGSVKFRMKKDVLFIATNNPGTRSDSDVLVEIKKGPIPANTTRNWSLEMEVPALDVYNLSACSYIRLSYKLEVVVSPSGCHRNSEESKQIILGTVPLVGYQDTVPNPLWDQMPQHIETMSQQPHNSSYPYPNTDTNVPHANAPYPDNPPPYPGNNLPYPGGQNVIPDKEGSGQGTVGVIGFTIPGANVNNAPFTGPNSVPTGSPVSGNPYSAASAPLLEMVDTEKKNEKE